MYSSSCTGSPGRTKVYKKPNLQCIKVPSSMYKRPDCTNSQSLVYNIFSHNIRLIFIPWAADQKFEVSGALGGDPQPVQPNIHYPHIVIPTDELEKSRQRADSMLAKLDKTPSLIRESELANRKMNTIDLEHRDDINLVNNTCSNAKIKLYPFHMSAEPKWCFLNYPKGGIGIFLFLTMSFVRGYVSSNQIHLLFGIFGQKMVKNNLKSTIKGLVWFGHGLVVILGWPQHV